MNTGTAVACNALIFKIFSYGSVIELQVIHNTTLRNPDGIAVDWIGRNIYWCDKTRDTIEVSKLNGSYRKVLIQKKLQVLFRMLLILLCPVVMIIRYVMYMATHHL